MNPHPKNFVSTKSKMLLVRPAKKSYQCNQSYLMQLADSNGLFGINQLAKLYGFTYFQMVNLPEECIKSIIWGEMEQHHYSHLKESVRKIHSPPTQTRICPYCIIDKIPNSTENNLPFSFVCRLHKSALFDSCPKCNCRYTYQRKYIGKCDLGCDILPQVFPDIHAVANSLQLTLAPWRSWYQGYDQTNWHNLFAPLEVYLCALIESIIRHQPAINSKRERLRTRDIVSLIRHPYSEFKPFLDDLSQFYESIFDPDLGEHKPEELISPIRRIYEKNFLCYSRWHQHISHIYNYKGDSTSTQKRQYKNGVHLQTSP